MTDQTIGVGIKATADFSDAEREARRVSESMRSAIEGGSRGGERREGLLSRMFGGDRRETTSAMRDMHALRDALERTNQSGSKLKDIKLDASQFGDAARELLNLQRNMDRLSHTVWGRDVRRRASMSGQDIDRPLSWDWRRMGYGSESEAEIARQHAWSRWAGAGHVGGGSGFGYMAAGAGARVISPIASRLGLGGVVGGIGSAVAGGGAIGGLIGGVAGAGALAAGAGGAKLVSEMFSTGYPEYLRTIETVDRMQKAMPPSQSFDDLRQAAKDTAEALQLIPSEAAELVASFASASNIAGRYAFEGAEIAGRFGRSIGVGEQQAAAQFGSVGLAGFASTPRAQREFAGMIAHTIAASNMYARSEQVLTDLAGYVGDIAQREGRTTGGAELEKYSDFLSQLYRSEPMRAGGARTAMQGLTALGQGGGMIKDEFLWRAFGPSVGWDYMEIERMKDAQLFQSPADLGIGDDKRTKLELMWDRVNKMSGWSYGSSASPERKRAWILKQLSGMGMGLGEEMGGIMDEFNFSGGEFGEFARWVQGSTGMSLDQVQPGSMRNLAMIYQERKRWQGDPSPKEIALVEQLISGSGGVSGAISDEQRAALGEAYQSGDVAALREMLPRLVAGAAYVGTAAEETRQANANLTAALESVGPAINSVVLSLKDLGTSVLGVSDHLKRLKDILGVDTGVLPNSGNWGGTSGMFSNPIVDSILGIKAEAFSRYPRSPRASMYGLGETTSPSGVRYSTGGGFGGLTEEQELIRDKIAAEAEAQEPGNKELAAAALALSWNESRWRNVIAAPNRAFGPFQFMPGTARDRGFDNRDLDKNIEHGIRDLRRHRDAKGGYPGAFAAHHAGPGAVTSSGRVKGYRHDGNISTQEHVRNIMETYERMKQEGLEEEKKKDNEKQSGLHDSSFDLSGERAYLEGPKLPQPHSRVVRAMGAQDPINARWQGQVAMEVVFRDARGNVVQKQNGLTVSEPRLAGSGGAYTNSNRFTWNDSVIIPG